MTRFDSTESDCLNPGPDISNNGKALMLTAIVLICFSLRAPITSIGPLAGLIHDDLGVSNSFIGFITTLPLIAFAVCSPLVFRVSDRLGIGRTMMAGLIAIVAGGILRAYTGVGGLLIGTGLIGIGISVGNVLIPSIVKLEFPERVGVITGIYMGSITLFASIGAGASYPLAEAGLGWKAASAVWAGIALLAAAVWLPQRKLGSGKRESGGNQRAEAGGNQSPESGGSKRTEAGGNGCAAARSRAGAGKKNIWKSPLAWYITIYNGLQSFNYFSMTAWEPSILYSYGMSPETAGYMALWFQLIGIGASFLIPILAARTKSQHKIVTAACVTYFLGISMLIAFHSTPAVLVALFLLSNGGNASFSWAMAMYGLKPKDAEESIKLSGMSQSVGYLLAATGPTLCGAIYDVVGMWSGVLCLFLGTSVIMIIAGNLASKRERLFS